MPIGVQVQMREVDLMMNFVEKFVELVLPQVRDFKGFQKSIGDGTGRLVTLRMPAETWQAFPEIGLTYLKFPQQGSVGSLQDFDVDFITTAKTDEEARLLLSGYRLPITYLDPSLSSGEDLAAASSDDVQDV
jgi:large subunit ribosomal protein L5